MPCPRKSIQLSKMGSPNTGRTPADFFRTKHFQCALQMSMALTMPCGEVCESSRSPMASDRSPRSVWHVTFSLSVGSRATRFGSRGAAATPRARRGRWPPADGRQNFLGSNQVVGVGFSGLTTFGGCGWSLGVHRT